AERDDVFIGSAIAHDTDRLHRKQHGKCLSGLAIPACLLQLIEKNGIGLAERLETLFGDLSQTAHSQSRARKRMAPDGSLRQPQLQAQSAHLVLEQILEWLNQLKAELRGQAADIVVSLNCGSGTVHRAAAFDDIRIQRALSQKANILDMLCFFFEDIDEHM